MKQTMTAPVPVHFWDAHYKGSEKLGHGLVIYMHIIANHYVEQQYLPDALKDEVFYGRQNRL